MPTHYLYPNYMHDSYGNKQLLIQISGWISRVLMTKNIFTFLNFIQDILEHMNVDVKI